VARPTSVSTEGQRAARLPGRSALGRLAIVAVGLGVVQAALFYDHFAVALTVLFGLGLGLWLRSWVAAGPALVSFLVGYALAAGTGWLHDARPVWEPLLGAMLAVLGGLTAGGMFDLLRGDGEAVAPPPRTIGPIGRRE
jgi:hypothetical protein